MSAGITKRNNVLELPKVKLEKRIADALKDLKHGSVTIVIQDAHVIQIERKEKFRMV